MNKGKLEVFLAKQKGKTSRESRKNDYRHLQELDELYWDLLEALQDGVDRELRNFVKHFSPTEKEKKLSNNIRAIVSEIYDEYVAKGRKLSEKPRST